MCKNIKKVGYANTSKEHVSCYIPSAVNRKDMTFLQVLFLVASLEAKSCIFGRFLLDINFADFEGSCVM